MYEPSVVYHLYNHTINTELAFRSPENYLFFLRKMREYLLPIGDILCYCLMPTHFHMLFRPNELGCTPSASKRPHRFGEDLGQPAYQQQISHTLRIMLSGYTKALNKQEGRRGALFRGNTKKKTERLGLADVSLHIQTDRPFVLGIPYLIYCFHYIHLNPVKAGLVDVATAWPYSSAADFAGLRNGTLPNFDLVEELLSITRSPNLY